jgi:5'-3' exonuclease
MGITKYNDLLKSYFNDSIHKLNDNIIKYDNIYIDLNYLLHLSMYLSNDENDFFKKLFIFLDNLIKKIFVLDNIMISIDGTSAYSKIILQRKRRKNSIKNINMKKLNSLHLTPGTMFMTKIKNKILSYIEDRKKNLFKFRNINFIFSSSDEPGEGEIKIIKQILYLNKNKNNKTNLIIGNDADLIVMSMSCTKVKNIHIFNKKNDGFYIIDINKIALKICKTIECKTKYFKKIKKDFSFISIMMGNDYLPKLQFVKNNILLESYYQTKKKYKGFIIKKNKFNILFFKTFLISIILNQNKRYRNIDLHKFNNKNIKKYLQGLLWCLKMYSSGKCPMYDYIFDEKSPTPIEILFYLEFNNITDINIPKSKIRPISNNIYPMLVMPKNASILIPYKYRKLLNNKFNFLFNEDYNLNINDIKLIINI